MATSLESATLDINFALTLLNNDTPMEARQKGKLTETAILSSGSGVNQADKVYSASGTLSASGNVQVNLATAVDVYGDAIALARIKAIAVRNKSNTTNNSLISLGGGTDGAGTNAFDSLFLAADNEIVIRPGFFCVFAKDATGYAVDASEVLRLTNEDSSNTVDYEILIIGASS